MSGGRLIQLDDDDAFQRRMWVVERLGWSAFALIVLAALTGFCGPGPASSTTRASGALEVRYDRFVRLQSPAAIEITLPVRGDQVRLQVSRDFLAQMSIEQVIPEPGSVEADTAFHTYVFVPAAGAEQIRVEFLARPGTVGRVRGVVQLEGGERVAFTQFVYP